MRLILVAALVLPLVACETLGLSSDPATVNRDTLGSAQSLWADAQRYALAYQARPRCPSPVAAPCRDPATYRKMQEADRAVTAAINKAKLDIEQNAAGSSAKLAVDAALAAAKSFLSTAKEAN